MECVCYILASTSVSTRNLTEQSNFPPTDGCYEGDGFEVLTSSHELPSVQLMVLVYSVTVYLANILQIACVSSKTLPRAT